MLERFEYLFEKLSFEGKVEERLITPLWFIRQQVFMRYADIVKTSLDSLVESLERIFLVSTKDFIKCKKTIYAVHNSLQGIQACHKLQANLEEVKIRFGEIEKHRLIKELPWPKWDLDNLNIKINTVYDTLIDLLVECLPKLSLVKHQANLPDYFGQAYHFIINECYNMLVIKNTVRFEKTFKSLLFSSLMTHDQLRKELKGQEPETFVTFSFDPLIDMMELSGYAKIYSELYLKPEIWNACERIWNTLLDNLPNSKDKIKLLVSAYEVKCQSFRIAPKDRFRTNWEIHLQNELNKAGLTTELYKERILLHGKSNREHTSPLIRVISGDFFAPHHSGAEVFIVTYILKRKESEGIEFADMRGLKRELDRELQKQTGEKKDEKN